MRTLHIIMPMAGEGSRFAREGYSQPKPLIEVNNTPLFLKAINSISDLKVPLKYSFIVRKEHIDKFQIDQQIRKHIPKALIYSVEQTTRGAVETSLIAKKGIEESEGILIMDCDLEFHSSNYNQVIKEILSGNNTEGGALVSFQSNNSRYSYARTENNRVVQTAEKEVISSNALIGAYFFASGSTFLQAANQLLLDNNHMKAEFYVSLLYNYLIRNDEPVYLSNCEQYLSYGTPEELNANLDKEQ